MELDGVTWLLTGAQSLYQLALLVAARIVPLVQLLPFLGGAVVPQPAKLGLSFALTILLMPVLLTTGTFEPIQDQFLFAICLMKEAIVGLTLGLIGSLVFESARIAGQIIDQMRGQTMASVMVPQLEQQASVTGNFLYQFATAIFLAVGGHLLFLRALLKTYETIGPFDAPQIDAFPALLEWSARLTADAITLGVMLALPILVAIVLIDLLLGLLNKSAPQINVFFLGMPLKSMLGIGALCITAGLFAEQFVTATVEHVVLFETCAKMVAR